MTLLILWGTVFSKNRGVNALTRATYDIVKDINNCDKIIVIGTGQKEYGIDDNILFFTMPGLHLLLLLNIYVIINKKKVLEYLFKNQVISDEITVLDLSEGDSFTDIYGRRFWNHILSKMLFRRFASKYILLPQTIGPFKKSISKIFASMVLNKMDIVFARDYKSKYFAEKLSGKQCKFCYDIAFCLLPKNIGYETRKLQK